jgi:hypothetical protein
MTKAFSELEEFVNGFNPVTNSETISSVNIEMKNATNGTIIKFVANLDDNGKLIVAAGDYNDKL